MRRKRRLIAGTINHVHDDEQYDNYTLDASDRPVWDTRIEMGVLPHFVMSITHMPDFRDEMWDAIKIHHVLEHLSENEARHAMHELNRILVPGGVLDIEVPDLDRIFEEWVNETTPKAELMQWIFSEDLPDIPHPWLNNHRFGYTQETLAALLNEYGFDADERLPSDDLSLRYVAVKR